MNVKELVNSIVSDGNSINDSNGIYSFANAPTMLEGITDLTHLSVPAKAYIGSQYHDVLRMLGKHDDLHASILKVLCIVQLKRNNALDLDNALIDRTLIQARATVGEDITKDLAGLLDQVEEYLKIY